MGEQPIFTCKAHVFHIDPKTKRSWIPASSSAINVSFFFDSTRSLYRIISVEGTKAVINSTITPNMTFTKTSQKFGQWSDVRANTVYGLGFPSEAELNKFIEKFQEVKEATKSISGTSPGKSAAGAAPATANGGSVPSPAVVPAAPPPASGAVSSAINNSTSVSANASPVNSRTAAAVAAANNLANSAAPAAYGNDDKDVIMIKPEYPTDGSTSPCGAVSPALLKSALVTHQRSQSLSGLQPSADSPKHQQKIDKSSPALGTGAGALGGVGSSATLPPQGSHLPLGSVEAQLKYENDRLKLALAQSSANAKKWEVELATLKNNNARLTNALQESTANVEEWKRQLQAYKDENQRVKNRIVELEAGRGGGGSAMSEGSAELKREVATLRLKVESLEAELRTKDDDVRRLTDEMRDINLASDRLKIYEEENSRLEASGESARSQMEAMAASHDTQRRILEALNAQLLEKIHELTRLQRDISAALET